MYDIIPDIHGQAEKLKAALRRLGYHFRQGAWRHADPSRTCIFLGDFIDRGPNNAEVIQIVRGMIDGGSAQAIMGNHELNAIHFHTLNPRDGKPLRTHCEKNTGQHQTFLNEFSKDRAATEDVIDWMRTLPLFLEKYGFRVVHACWDEDRIGQLRGLAPTGVLSAEQLILAGDQVQKDPLYDLLEVSTKGPEAKLPDGYCFKDKDGHDRDHVRVQWWKQGTRSWADIAMSVPNPDDLPNTALPKGIANTGYRVDAKPVFFGHYWMQGTPVLQAPNALCLDYSAGTTGPLVTYLLGAEQNLSLDSLVVHDL